MMNLTDLKVRNAKAKDKRYRMLDFDGLYLEVRPNGTKSWLVRYTGDDSKEHWKSIGSYPVYSLADARAKMLEMKRVGLGLASPKKGAIPFETVAREFFEQYKRQTTSKKSQDITIRRLEMHVFPLIGKKNIYDVATKDMFAVVERLTNRDARDTARRVVQFCSRIFEFAMLKEYCETNPCYALRSQIAKEVARKKKHLPAIIEPERVANLLRSIDAYTQTIVRLAMQFSALTFCRPGEIRHAEWSEIDLDKKVWELPASKMKMKREHMVPLADQAIEVLRKLKPLTGGGKYLFPSSRAPKGDRPMSDSTVLVALRTMGYPKEEMTAHGFRTMASTLLNGNGFNRDWIEMQLAHAPLDQVRDAYNRAKYWNERVMMMNWYADYLDALKNGEPAPPKKFD